MFNQRAYIEEAPSLPLEEKQAGSQRPVNPSEVEVTVREWVANPEGHLVPEYKSNRVQKLTPAQEEHLEKFITKRLPNDTVEARRIVAKVLEGDDYGWQAWSQELKQLWCCYHRKHREEIEEMEDEAMLSEVEHCIVKAAALKVFYKLLEPELADAEFKPVPLKISTLALLGAIFDSRISELGRDVSSKIFSYVSPIDLYLSLHLINKKALNACLELKPYIQADIKQNRNVFYTIGEPVIFVKRPDNFYGMNFGYRAKILNKEFRLSYNKAACDGKLKVFKSRYAALKSAERIRSNLEDEFKGGRQPAIYKVVCWGNDYDENRQEVFFTVNQGVRTNYLIQAEQSALVEFAEISTARMMPVAVSLPILNDTHFTYKTYHSQFVTPFDSDSSFEYLDWHAQQQSQRNWYTFYVILSAIFLSPLSLLVTFPLWFSAKRNEPIQKLEISEEDYKNIVSKEKQFKNISVDDEKKESKESVIFRKPLAPGEHVENSTDRSRKIIYCDKYRKDRLMFFKRCHDTQITVLTDADKEYLSQSEKQSKSLVDNLSRIERSRVKAG